MVSGKNGNGNRFLSWEWVGMGMGMVLWEWEGMGTEIVLPASETRMPSLSVFFVVYVQQQGRG